MAIRSPWVMKALDGRMVLNPGSSGPCRWDRFLDLTLRRGVYGTLAGALVAGFMLRSPYTRTAAVAFGAGAGLGSAWQAAANEVGAAAARVRSLVAPVPCCTRQSLPAQWAQF